MFPVDSKIKRLKRAIKHEKDIRLKSRLEMKLNANLKIKDMIFKGILFTPNRVEL